MRNAWTRSLTILLSIAAALPAAAYAQDASKERAAAALSARFETVAYNGDTTSKLLSAPAQADVDDTPDSFERVLGPRLPFFPFFALTQWLDPKGTLNLKGAYSAVLSGARDFEGHELPWLGSPSSRSCLVLLEKPGKTFSLEAALKDAGAEQITVAGRRAWHHSSDPVQVEGDKKPTIYSSYVAEVGSSYLVDCEVKDDFIGIVTELSAPAAATQGMASVADWHALSGSDFWLRRAVPKVMTPPSDSALAQPMPADLASVTLWMAADHQHGTLTVVLADPARTTLPDLLKSQGHTFYTRTKDGSWTTAVVATSAVKTPGLTLLEADALFGFYVLI